ncbi:uncharacterized protein LOC135502313 [Lineus longissimus]|uniref:uncharacterized protein LOC135502313 n=1 Tax=Lineus longissimus TaxID=88925 RepID=UPI00315D1495
MCTGDVFVPALVTLLVIVGGVSAKERGKILMFGGNGLIGAAVTEALVSFGYDVTLTNRGTWYWDTDRTIKPFVRQIYCDRYSVFMMAGTIARECPDLVEFVESVDRFEAVVDFSAYDVAVVTQALEILESKVGVYVYISSDSVYEVCDKHHTDPTRETDAVRPDDMTRREELNKADDYGNKKLLCEEELIRANLAGGPPYVFLRLPDVIGARDNTDRWWIYQLWAKLAKHMGKPVTHPTFLKHQQLGMVFSEDVGQAVVKILGKNDPNLLYNKAYNLAFEEHMTLPELIAEIGRNIGVGEVPMEIDPKDYAYYLFPSVKKGPVDITLAKTAFDFSPTPLKVAIKAAADFYEMAIRDEKYEKYRKRILGKLGKDVFQDKEKMKSGLALLYPDKFHSDKQDREEL